MWLKYSGRTIGRAGDLDPPLPIPCTPMASLNDNEVKALLEAPNYAVISTKHPDGSILSTVVWISLEDGVLAVNSSEGGSGRPTSTARER